MKPRDLRSIFTRPAATRMDIVADGLILLAEHVGALHESRRSMCMN
ncbi:hypothetical protein [Kitasatospora sp. NPDC057223]